MEELVRIIFVSFFNVNKNINFKVYNKGVFYCRLDFWSVVIYLKILIFVGIVIIIVVVVKYVCVLIFIFIVNIWWV